MAVILPGPMISNIRGSIGGTSFHQGRAGIVAGRRPAQSKSKTISQSVIQNLFIGALQAYQNLTITQKKLWDAYSIAYPHTNKFGQQRLLTGQNYFFALNYYRLQLPESPFLSPPARVLPPATGPYNIILTSNEIFLQFVPVFTPANCAFAIFATPPITGITNSQRSKWRFLKSVLPPTNGILNVTSEWNAKFLIDYSSLTTSGVFNLAFMIITFNLLSGVYNTGLIKFVDQSQIQDFSYFYYYAS